MAWFTARLELSCVPLLTKVRDDSVEVLAVLVAERSAFQYE